MLHIMCSGMGGSDKERLPISMILRSASSVPGPTHSRSQPICITLYLSSDSASLILDDVAD